MRINFVQKVIDKLRGKKRNSCNVAGFYQFNDIRINENIRENVNLNIIGKNNKIIINTDAIIGKLNLKIFGDNNYILIDENVSVSSGLSILIGKNHPNFGKVCNSKLEIHKDTSIESMEYYTYNSNTFCVIEEQCMLSYGILIYNTDGHPIFDKDTGELLNKPRGITIGKHSWIGMKATILKNSIVPRNSVIACNAVYACGSRGGGASNCIFAGNPAKIVKENIVWDANGNKYGYIENIL